MNKAAFKKMEMALKSAEKEKEEPKKEESKVKKALDSQVVKDSPNGTKKVDEPKQTATTIHPPVSIQTEKKHDEPEEENEKLREKVEEPEKVRGKPGKKPKIQEKRNQQILYFTERTTDSLKMSALPSEQIKAKRNGTLEPDLSLLVENILVKWLKENNYLIDI